LSLSVFVWYMTKKNTRRIRPKQAVSNRLKKDEWETVEDL